MSYNVYIGSPKGKSWDSVLIDESEKNLVTQLFGYTGFKTLNGLRGNDLYHELSMKVYALEGCIDNDTWLGEQIGTLTTFLGKLRQLRNLCHNYPSRKFKVM